MASIRSECSAPSRPSSTRPRSARATKQRAVLAMLALNANRALSVDRLVEGLWGEHPPASAAKMVQLYVSQLRKLLGDGRDRHARPCVRAAGGAGRRRCRALRARSPRPERRCPGGAEAVAGPALADVAEEPFAAAEIRRLDELRISALEAPSRSTCGTAVTTEALTELEALLADNPLRERLHAHRMLALYHSGRQADALEAYRAARDTLVGELGLEPGPELRELHEAILRHDPALRAGDGARRFRRGPSRCCSRTSRARPASLQEHGRAFADMLAEHRRSLRTAAERHRGVEFGSEGDALFFAFTAARDAAAAARDAQAALAEGPMPVRMGIHTGEPEIHDGGTWASTCIGPRGSAPRHTEVRWCSPSAPGRCSATHSSASRSACTGSRISASARSCSSSAPRVFPPLRSLNASNLPAPPSRLDRTRRRAERDPAAPARAPARDADGSGRRRQDPPRARGGRAIAATRSTTASGGSPLAAVSEPDLVLPTVAQTLGAQAPLAEHIDERRMLILLDNLEQVVDCAPSLLGAPRRLPRPAPCSRRAERRCGFAPNGSTRSHRSRSTTPSSSSSLAPCAPTRSPRCAPSAHASTRCRSPSSSRPRARARSRLPSCSSASTGALPCSRRGRSTPPTGRCTLRATIEWSYELLAPRRGRALRAPVGLRRELRLGGGAGRLRDEPRCARVARRAEPARADPERALLHARDDSRVCRRAARP